MMPGPLYRLPDNAVSIKGNALPGSRVRAVFKPESNPLKLLYDYKDGEIIRIFSQEIKAMDGRSFTINDKENFTIIQTLDLEERAYLMDRELKSSYKKGSSRIYLVEETLAKENGAFFMTARCFGRGATCCRIEMEGSGYAPVEIKIKPGEKVLSLIHISEPTRH